MRETIIVAAAIFLIVIMALALAVMRCSAMLRKTIYAMPIIILTMGTASAQTAMQQIQDLKGGQNSWRTETEKKNDRDIDRAYDSAIKRLPNTEKKKSDPWADARSPSPAPDKQ